MKPNRITVSRSARGTTIKATGAAANALFARMAAEVDGITTPEQVGPCTVHFEDHGQDFLEWDVDATGKVIDSRPLQAYVWVGAQVIAAPEPGRCIRFKSALNGEVKRIAYPVQKVTQLITDAMADQLIANGAATDAALAADKLSP